MSVQLRFVGMLLSVKSGEFISQDGGNKGVKYEWSDLQFSTKETGAFTLRSVAPVTVSPENMEKVLEWVLEMDVKERNGKATMKVANITGGKVK